MQNLWRTKINGFELWFSGRKAPWHFFKPKQPTCALEKRIPGVTLCDTTCTPDCPIACCTVLVKVRRMGRAEVGDASKHRRSEVFLKIPSWTSEELTQEIHLITTAKFPSATF